MLNAEKSGKFRPGNFSIRNDDCSAEVLALPALSSSSLLTALKRTGHQICVSRVVLLLLLLLLLLATATATAAATGLLNSAALSTFPLDASQLEGILVLPSFHLVLSRSWLLFFEALL